eukprot:scaffold35604_cov244-Amphora_coffeaeformis.AAC.3
MASPLAPVPPPMLLVEANEPSSSAADAATTAVVDTSLAAAVVAPVLAAAAVASASSLSADTLLPLVQLALALNNNSNNEQQPLIQLLPEYRVRLQDDNLAASLVQLEAMILACEQAADRQAGRAPGFTSRTQGPNLDAFVGRTWSSNSQLPYETLDMHQESGRSFLPVPSIYSAWQTFQVVRTVLQERWQFLQSDDLVKNTFCSCISKWDHVDGSIAMQLVNQCMEQCSHLFALLFLVVTQLMVQEASEVLYRRIEEMGGMEVYDAQEQKNVQLTYASHIPVQLLTDRDRYLAAFTRACLASKELIQISTCYVFYTDPAQIYVLFDLLPFLVKRGVKVQLLMDLMVMESTTLKSAFYTTDRTIETPRRSAAGLTDVTALSFWKHLPDQCPPPTAGSKFVSADDFFQALVDMSGPNFDIQFWCARDDQEHYRIKNHAKCAVFDKTVAILGGSNLTPTIKSATADLDVMVSGQAADEVSASFESLFYAMSRRDNSAATNSSSSFDAKASTMVMEEKKDANDNFVDMIRGCEWDDSDCQVAILRSTPSSNGDDVIYHVVLDKLRSARIEFLMTMGHSCFPMSFALAAKDATERGVRVGVTVNSLYSNDLRTGQRDLFLSIRDVLKIAPKVEFYATSMSRNTSLAGPEFLHAKYATVDHCWSAVGSWNCWNRSAFYEIEHEAFVESPQVAGVLREKFFRDAGALCTLVADVRECQPGGKYCPKGCFVCQGFGPFYQE